MHPFQIVTEGDTSAIFQKKISKFYFNNKLNTHDQFP